MSVTGSVGKRRVEGLLCPGVMPTLEGDICALVEWTQKNGTGRSHGHKRGAEELVNAQTTRAFACIPAIPFPSTLCPPAVPSAPSLGSPPVRHGAPTGLVNDIHRTQAPIGVDIGSF